MLIDSKKVSIIIVNWNGLKYLKDCLKSLTKQTVNDFSIILLDNNSKDGTVEYVATNFPCIKIIVLDSNKGFAIPNNIGYRASRSKYVVTLNNDTVVHPNWLEALTSALDNNPSAGFAASKMLWFDDKSRIDRIGDSYTTAGVGKLRGRNYPSNCFKRSEYIFGACAGAAIYRRSMLDDVGFLDEKFFLIYEDIDLSFRSQLLGYKCIDVPEAIVYHRGSKSIVTDSHTSVYYGHRNLEWVYVANMPIRLFIACAPMHLLYIILAFIYFFTIGKHRPYIEAKIDAFKGLRHAIYKRKIVQKRKIVSDAYIRKLLYKETFWHRIRNRT